MIYRLKVAMVAAFGDRLDFYKIAVYVCYPLVLVELRVFTPVLPQPDNHRAST